MVKLKAEQSETKSRRPATVQDLPKGANEDAAWSRLVVPNFINLILAGNQPWIITDDLIIAELQCIWDHVYGRRVEFAIEKGTVPYKLVSFMTNTYILYETLFIPLQITQKLCDYRNRLAYKAICVAVAYIRSHLDAADEDSFDDLGDELAEFADSLLNHEIPQAFIFKGMENIQKVPWYQKSQRNTHVLIAETDGYLPTHSGYQDVVCSFFESYSGAISQRTEDRETTTWPRSGDCRRNKFPLPIRLGFDY